MPAIEWRASGNDIAAGGRNHGKRVGELNSSTRWNCAATRMALPLLFWLIGDMVPVRHGRGFQPACEPNHGVTVDGPESRPRCCAGMVNVKAVTTMEGGRDADAGEHGTATNYHAHTAQTVAVVLSATLVATARKNWTASTCKIAEAQCAAPRFCHGASRAIRP